MSLPFLPGNSFDKNVGKSKFHKSHVFDYANDVSLMNGTSKPGIGGDRLPGQVVKAPFSQLPRGEGGALPTWVAFDKQVLSFDAYFQEPVVERRGEQYRVRKVKIYFYLEDDTIQVVEPRSRNAGVDQGTIIKRHRIQKPAPFDNQFYTVEDLNIGNEINLYARVLKIVDADQFTKNFLTKLGVRLGNPCEVPDDPYAISRKAQDETMQPLRPYERHDTLGQFISHDRHVLRFYCFWDDRENMFGDARRMIIHYFLSDDTVEILEVLPPNCGRDAAPLFLRRQKLPKNLEALRLPGEVCDRTILNVFGSLGPSGRYIVDNLKMGEVKVEFYSDADLRIGQWVNVYGRKLLLCEVDEFTREYYRQKYGIDDFTPAWPHLNGAHAVEREIPPWNGFGGEEDSLANCMPNGKPPRRDFVRQLEMDKDVLRFLARMVSDKPVDSTRRVILSFFLADDTILLFEPGQAGIQACKFLERRRVKKPGQTRYPVKTSEYWQAQDFFVGAEVEIENFRFQLVDADEYAYRYMESHPEQFAVADVQRVLGKLSKALGGKLEEVRGYFARNDPQDSGVVQFEQLRSLMRQLGGFVEHEVITVGRYFSDRAGEQLDRTEVVASAQHQLRKKNYEELDGLKMALEQRDKNKSGFLPVKDVLQVFKSVSVPIDNDVLNALIEISPRSAEGGDVNYRELFAALDWRTRQVQLTTQQLKRMEVKTLGSQVQEDPFATAAARPGLRVDAVNYRAILIQLFGENALKV